MAYITEYSILDKKEQRQLKFKRRYKSEHPNWDDSMVLLVELLKSRLSNGMSVLDAGCGKHNFVLDELSFLHFKEKIGLDATKEVTEGNQSVDRIVYGNLNSIPFPDNSFDLVTSLWVLEHLENPKKVFSEIYRILKPNGIFAFVTPNADSFLIRLRSIMNKHIAERLVYYFYGRVDEDTFEVFYRANRIKILEQLASNLGFKQDIILLNQDPSYTSFDGITYFLSKNLALLKGSLFKPHIVSILQKP